MIRIVISNNHDPYDSPFPTRKPVLIQKGAWIGAGAYIMPGVSVGKYAIVVALEQRFQTTLQS